MSHTVRPRSRRGRIAGFRHLLIVLGAGILTLALVGSGAPGPAGAAQPGSGAGTASPAGDLAAGLVAGSGTAAGFPSVASSSGGSPVVGGPGPDAPVAGARLPAGPGAIPDVALQARLDAIRLKYRLPGVSATIIWPDGRTWSGASGWADIAHHVKVFPGTAFSIGSVSKTFLATLVLELVHEGRLTLDDPVRHWLPTAKVSTNVTVRELLDHTSGLYDFFGNPLIDTALLARPKRVWTPAMALGYMKAPYCDPGTCWVYSNSNYVLLGQIVEQVTGRPVTTELRERFFDPLGLSRTFVQGVEPRRGTVATAYKLTGTPTSRGTTSLADGTGIAPFTSVVTAAGTAGDIASSSVDLARWARALYGGAVLAPDSLAMMLDTSRSKQLHAAKLYGFGMEVVILGGRFTVGHNGRLIGSRASIRYLPQSGFTVAVVTNQDPIGPDVFGTSLLNIAIASLTPPLPAPWQVGSASAPPAQLPLPFATLRGPSSAPGVPAGSPAAGGTPRPSPTLGPPPELYPPGGYRPPSTPAPPGHERYRAL
jgi:D-alanyl-D-alanine carboxypeptidase